MGDLERVMAGAQGKVVVSADATARQIEWLKQAGAHAYLTKPIEVDKLCGS